MVNLRIISNGISVARERERGNFRQISLTRKVLKKMIAFRLWTSHEKYESKDEAAHDKKTTLEIVPQYFSVGVGNISINHEYEA